MKLIVTIKRSFLPVYKRFGELVFLCRKFTNDNKTYYPEYISHRKGNLQIFVEQVINIIRFSQYNRFYFLYGFDIKKFRNQREYVDYWVFRNKREKLNRKSPNVPIAVLRDKFIFSCVANVLDINTPQNLAIIERDRVYLISEKKSVSLLEFLENCELSGFLKKSNGECADGVYYMVLRDNILEINGQVMDKKDFYVLLGDDRFLFQEPILNQHPAIKRLNPASVNTIRLITVYDVKNNVIICLPSLLRVGNGSTKVDNWAAEDWL